MVFYKSKTLHLILSGTLPIFVHYRKIKSENHEKITLLGNPCITHTTSHNNILPPHLHGLLYL